MFRCNNSLGHDMKMEDLDMIISMNFEHIVKRKTKIGTGNINALNGYRAVEIYSPMEVVENESD